ncbi:hypothetical protein BU16DRAFT_561809 [Lophium mytilinum]|uniref:Uncharacterized protein n=1 Tax=Lophium mytilinum TaxID=390894 RepID=A0A6A6QWX8_9PEZI|nr:hypothetical protein BU16DRAFT_561809 [Lophium mytilinum]
MLTMCVEVAMPPSHSHLRMTQPRHYHIASIPIVVTLTQAATPKPVTRVIPTFPYHNSHHTQHTNLFTPSRMGIFFGTTPSHSVRRRPRRPKIPSPLPSPTLLSPALKPSRPPSVRTPQAFRLSKHGGLLDVPPVRGRTRSSTMNTHLSQESMPAHPLFRDEAKTAAANPFAGSKGLIAELEGGLRAKHGGLLDVPPIRGRTRSSTMNTHLSQESMPAHPLFRNDAKTTQANPFAGSKGLIAELEGMIRVYDATGLASVFLSAEAEQGRSRIADDTEEFIGGVATDGESRLRTAHDRALTVFISIKQALDLLADFRCAYGDGRTAKSVPTIWKEWDKIVDKSKETKAQAVKLRDEVKAQRLRGSSMLYPCLLEAADELKGVKSAMKTRRQDSARGKRLKGRLDCVKLGEIEFVVEWWYKTAKKGGELKRAERAAKEKAAEEKAVEEKAAEERAAKESIAEGGAEQSKEETASEETVWCILNE